MGLLDEAIRDHLELKRRRGADPTEIAREEREALEPVFPDEPRSAGYDGEPQAGAVLDEEPPHGDPLEEAAAAAETAPPADAHAPGAAAEDPFAAQPLGEETAEIDMEAVLAEDAPELDDAAAAGPERDGTAPPVAAAPAGEALRPPPQGEEDLLEWEVPGEREHAGEPPEPLPGQESMSFE